MQEDKPSKTALSIAVSQFLMGKTTPYKDLIQPDQLRFSETLLKTIRESRYNRLRKLRRYPWVVNVLGKLQGFFLVPGLSTFHICRKMAFQTSAEKIIHQKMEKGEKLQVVAFAAGFDTMTYRLAKKYPDINFFETDHPATQKPKREIYDKLNYHVDNNILISCDYTKEELRDVLVRNDKFQKDVDTLFLAEGLVFYLPHDIYLDILSYMKEFIGNESYMIYSYMQYKPGTNRPGFARQSFIVDRWLDKVSEPFLWARGREELNQELNDHGYEMLEYYGTNDLREQFMPNSTVDIAAGEDVVVVKHQKA